MNTVFDEEPLSAEEIRSIEQSFEDLRAGRVYTLDEVMTELKEDERCREKRSLRRLPAKHPDEVSYVSGGALGIYDGYVS